MHPEDQPSIACQGWNCVYEGPSGLKEEQELLQRELDNKTLSDEGKEQYLQKMGIIPYSELEGEDWSTN